MTAAALFAALLYATLTLWVPERWAWESGSRWEFFRWPGGGWGAPARSARRPPRRPCRGRRLATDAGGGGRQRRGRRDLDGGTDWAAFLVVFLVAKDILSGQRERHWFLGAISLGGMTVAAVPRCSRTTLGGARSSWLFPSGYTGRRARAVRQSQSIRGVGRAAAAGGAVPGGDRRRRRAPTARRRPSCWVRRSPARRAPGRRWSPR